MESLRSLLTLDWIFTTASISAQGDLIAYLVQFSAAPLVCSQFSMKKTRTDLQAQFQPLTNVSELNEKTMTEENWTWTRWEAEESCIL